MSKFRKMLEGVGVKGSSLGSSAGREKGGGTEGKRGEGRRGGKESEMG